jgi:outer membrane protein assembly factor BamB
MRSIYSSLFLALFALTAPAQTVWNAQLDGRIRFYHTTDFGAVIAGTERSLYALDGQTGERLWRRETGPVHETAVNQIPDTDLLLLTRDLGSKSRLEAVDLISGDRIWQSEKVKGDVLQLAADPSKDLLAVVLVKDPRGTSGEGIKRKPIVHVLSLATGEELWKREIDSKIELMPAEFRETGGGVDYTLDNFRPPLLLDERLFLFYEGATSYDARTGKEKEREKFKVNEDGLALTEADPVFDATRIFISGRGRIRAVDRRTGDVGWTADDVGSAAEMALVGNVLYVRTGGQFTRIRGGEVESKGPFGVSAIDTRSGKVLWRYKGADKGLSNMAHTSRNSIVIADRDDLIELDARSGKPTTKVEHQIKDAQFVLVNESGQVVIGGRDAIAAFRGRDESWRVRHKPPSRGVLRTVAGIAFRATALYFRYGGFATSAYGFARSGVDLARAGSALRWSGLRSRFGSLDLTTLAANSARSYVTSRIYSYGSLARSPNAINRAAGLQVITPGSVVGNVAGRSAPSRADVRESFGDRLDPARYADRLANYLLRRKRLAELRGNFMYFYTELPKPFDGKGLIGVNIHDGRDGRFVSTSDPDPRFVTDETLGLLFTADGDRLRALDLTAN